MANDILDDMLLELEKQVQDFTMSVDDRSPVNKHTDIAHNKSETNVSSDDIPLQAYKKHLANFEGSNFKSTPLQRSATSRKLTENKPATTLGHSKSLRSNRKPQRDDPSSSFQTNEEMRSAMQKWPLPDVTNNNNTEEQQHEVENGPITNSGLKSTSIVRTLVTRIYIDNAQNYKTVQLTNHLTTAMIVQYLKKKGLLDNTDQWTLFEIANSHGVERPFREWEIVLDIISAWEPDAGNALLVKKYPYHFTLVPEALQMSIVPMHGWISIEYKKGKWQKRFCFIKDNAIYHAKDNKGSTPSVLCHLASYDVYTLLQPPRASPTPFVFVIRSQDRASIFEKESDYIRFLAVDDQEEMKNWVLSIRSAKSHVHYQHHPNRVMNPLAPISSESDLKHAKNDENKPLLKNEQHNTDEEKIPAIQSTLRRHKSTRELHTKTHNPAISDELVKQTLTRSDTKKLGRSATTSRGLGRSATMGGRRRKNTLGAGDENMPDGPLIDCSEPPTFAKGSLLANEEEIEQQMYRQQQQQQYQQQQQQHQQQAYHHHQQQQQQHHSSQQEENSNTLIQIDDRFKFAKGSLLDKKENPVKITRSKSERDPLSSNHVNNMSLDSNSEQPQHRRHVSLRRKPTGRSLPHPDVPLPNTTPVVASPSSPPPPLPTTPNSGNTLLQLNLTPETFHSRELKGRHVKPLINFDAEESHRIRK
ncbi:hypothetical protein K501DRAFT_263623 [Backusella circina FSU 941]|nr:hypothetical protein K501DRAFT_263623 [Backusella circina FSU 941]